MATRIVAKTELRERIREELASLGEDTLVITDRGRPVAVATSVERWNELQERIEDMEDALAVLESRASGEQGEPAAAVLDELDADVRGPARASG